MARRDVIEIDCGRCGRKEIQSSTEVSKPGVPELDATFQGEKLHFDDLCKRCRAAVKGYFTRMAKKEDDQIAPEKPAPVAPPPAHTPEKPADPKKHGLFSR